MNALHDVVVDLVAQSLRRQITHQEVVVLLDVGVVVCVLVNVALVRRHTREHGNVLQEHRVRLHDVHVVEGLVAADLIETLSVCREDVQIDFHHVSIQDVLVFFVLGANQHFQIVLAHLPISVILDHVLNETYLLVLRLQAVMRVLQRDCKRGVCVVMLTETLDSAISHLSDRLLNRKHVLVGSFLRALTAEIAPARKTPKKHIRTNRQRRLMNAARHIEEETLE